jgi:uncharacterized membrane-anchored protein
MTLHQERTLSAAEPIFLELAPVDPRSLLQGDFMALSYRISRDIPRRVEIGSWPRRGRVVVELDPRRVASFVRRDDGQSLDPNQRLLGYEIRAGRPYFGAESYFFQEGRGSIYERAQYAELRVDGAGRSVLVGLRDAELMALGP